MGRRALPCLLRIVAACPRSRLMRVCASHNKTFPGHGSFILIQPPGRDPCSHDHAGYAASERPNLLAAGRPVPPASRPDNPRAPGIPGQGTRTGIPGHASPPPDKQTHRWPLEDQPVLRANGAIWLAPPPSRWPGPIRLDTAASGVARHSAAHMGLPTWGGWPRGDDSPGPAMAMDPGTRQNPRTLVDAYELWLMRTSARLRTPRRCWPEYARAH
jgi:hypothetical protein